MTFAGNVQYNIFWREFSNLCQFHHKGGLGRVDDLRVVNMNLNFVKFEIWETTTTDQKSKTFLQFFQAIKGKRNEVC